MSYMSKEDGLGKKRDLANGCAILRTWNGDEEGNDLAPSEGYSLIITDTMAKALGSEDSSAMSVLHDLILAAELDVILEIDDD